MRYKYEDENTLRTKTVVIERVFADYPLGKGSTTIRFYYVRVLYINLLFSNLTGVDLLFAI